ncbi:MAG: hypothetical protein AB7U85_08470 [Alphaproteobacteria bacterium]
MPYKSLDSFFDCYQRKGRFSSFDNNKVKYSKFRYNLTFTTDRKRWHNKPLYHKGLLSNLDGRSVAIIGLFQVFITALTAGLGLMFFPPLVVAKIVALCVAIGAFFLGSAYLVANKKMNSEFFTGWSCHKSRLILDFLIHPEDIKDVAKKNFLSKEKITYKPSYYISARRSLFDNEYLALPKSNNSKQGDNA